MKTSSEYIQLHNPEKEANGYEGYRDGEEMDILTAHGFSPTSKMMAVLCGKGKTNKIQYYLKQGVPLSEQMFTLACLFHQFETANFLIDKGIIPTSDFLLEIVVKGDLTVAAFLLDKGTECPSIVLEIACFSNNLAMTQFLIDRGAIPTEDMLSFACVQNNISIVTLLIQNGVVPTPEMLETAIEKGNTLIVDMLRKADITTESLLTETENISDQPVPPLLEEVDEISEQSLRRACSSGNLVLAQHLVDQEILPTTEMLQEACINANIPVARFLMNHGVIPTKKMLGTVCVYYAFQHNKHAHCKPEDKIKIMCEILQLEDFITAFMALTDFSDDIVELFEVECKGIERFMENLCLRANKLPVIKELVKKGAPLTEKMLMYSLFSENLEAANYLINQGVKATEDMLGVCCSNLRFSAAEFLMTHGVKPNATILRIMCELEIVPAVKFILNAGVVPTLEIVTLVQEKGSADLKSILSESSLDTQYNVNSSISSRN